MTPEELLQYFVSRGGSTGLNEMENLFNASDSLLLQAGLGVPGIDAEYISDWVRDNAYERYLGQDPRELQEDVNEVLRRLSEALNIENSDLNAMVQMADSGVDPTTVVQVLTPELYMNPDGTPDTSQYGLSPREGALIEGLVSALGSHADFAQLERDVEFDPVSGLAYVKKPDDEVARIMASAGLTGQFADPELWVAQLPQDRLDRSAEAATMAAEERRQMDAIRQLSDLDSEVYAAETYDPTNIFEQFARESARRSSDRALAEEEAERLANSRSGGRIINLVRPESRSGGRKINIIPNQRRIVIRDDEEPFRRIVVRGSDGENRDLQTEQAIKSAQRYAMFSALENAENNRRVNEARANEIAAPQLLPMGGVQTRQDSLDAVALSNALQAKDEATIPGAQNIDAFRNFLALNTPSTKSTSTKPQRVRLSSDQISNAVDGLLAPTRRRV